MRKIDGNRRRLSCRQGEPITVEVTSEGTNHNVAFSLNGLTFVGETFTVDTKTTLGIFGVFSSNTGGGKYNIRITGDPGGDEVEDSILQDQAGEIFEDGSRAYIFSIGL